MGWIDFGNEQGNVRIRAVIFGVADDGIASAGEVFLGAAGDARIERGKDEVAIEAGIEAFDDEGARGFRNGAVEMPADGFGVAFAGGAFGGGDFRELEPRMIREKFYEALADKASCA